MNDSVISGTRQELNLENRLFSRSSKDSLSAILKRNSYMCAINALLLGLQQTV